MAPQRYTFHLCRFHTQTKLGTGKINFKLRLY